MLLLWHYLKGSCRVVEGTARLASDRDTPGLEILENRPSFRRDASPGAARHRAQALPAYSSAALHE